MNGVKRGAQAATNDAKNDATERDTFVSSDAPTPAPRVAARYFDDARLSAASRYEADRLPLLALPAGSEAGRNLVRAGELRLAVMLPAEKTIQ